MDKKLSRRIKEIHYQISHHEEALKKLGAERVKAYSAIFLTCSKCSQKSNVGKTTLVDVYQWDPNTGSPCGGYFQHYQYQWECTKCGYFHFEHSVEYDIPHGAFKHGAFKVVRREDE